MSSSNADRGQQLESAREREFDSLLEQEFAGEPPVAAILKRARHGAGDASPKPARSWLAAALVLLGIGVAVAVAWSTRVDRDDHKTATPQDPTPVETLWPKDVPRIYGFDKLSTVPDDATHISLAMELAKARDFSRWSKLQHLEVRLTPSGMGKLINAGGGKEGTRLDVLKTAQSVRRLSIGGVPLGGADLLALSHLPQLQVLELNTLFEINDELMAAMQKGGMVIGRPFDAKLGEAIARSSRAKTLRLTGMPITAAGLRALAAAELHSLILSPSDVTPEVLKVLGELKTLRRLELRGTHSASLAKGDGGSIAANGLRALSPVVMQAIASLPVLQSLTLHLCHLDPEVVAALPRKLQRLDLSSCFGVDGSLVDVVAAMPELQEIGLPIAMVDGKDYASAWRPPLREGDLHRRRLSGDQAASIIGSRVWQALSLEGQLTEAVANELANQIALRTLILRPTAKSASLAFASRMPKLESITFVEADLTVPMLQPLNECASLRTVAFHACRSHMEQVKGRLGLRRDIAVRWGFRMVR